MSKSHEIRAENHSSVISMGPAELALIYQKRYDALVPLIWAVPTAAAGMISPIRIHIVTKQSFFSKLGSVLKGGSAEHLLKDIFNPIANDHPQLTRDLVSFCLSGEPAAVLGQARLIQHQHHQELFGPIASTRLLHWNPSENASAKARVRLISHFDQGQIEPVVLIRTAKALAELVSDTIQKHAGDQFPDWLHLILADWLHHLEERGHHRAKSGLLTPPLTLDHLQALCLHEDLCDSCWLPYYIDRCSVGRYWGYEHVLAAFDKLEGLAGFLSNNRDHLTNRLYPELSAAGKVNCLKVLGAHNLIGDCTPFIARQLVNSSKLVRKEAALLLTAIPVEAYRSEITHYLIDGNASERKAAAEYIGCTMAEQGRPLLEEALEKETSKSVTSVIEIAMGGTSFKQESQAESPLELPDYDRPDLNNRVSDEVVDTIHRHIQGLQEKQRKIEVRYDWQRSQQKQILALSRADAVKVVKIMNGEDEAQLGWHSVNHFMNDRTLYEHPSIDLINALRLKGKPIQNKNRRPDTIQHGAFSLWLNRQPGKLRDLRALDEVLKVLGWPNDTIELEILCSQWNSSQLFNGLPKEGIWPYFAQSPELLTASLTAISSGKGNWQDISMDRVLEVLSCFPSLPSPVRAGMLQLALGEGKTYRERAQTLLSDLPGIADKVVGALKSTAQESRINAARWLARLQKREAILPLREALAKESREAARATLLSALESLGEDISDFLNPQALLKEAQKGLKKRLPMSLDWFPFETLPALQWEDGEAVDPALPKWWVILACKIKDPGANELLLKYLQRLSEPSRHALALHLLRAFIAQDTRNPSVEEAEAKATAGAPGQLQLWQRWSQYDWGKEFKDKTLEDAHATIRDAYLSTYLGSAIKAKGILSLCAYAPGAEVVALVRAYMKDHYTRRAQIESMLKALALGNDSHVIQLLLSVARRYRTRSVQETARSLVDKIAQRNGWSQDELADRTMPTAGFDEQGKQQLDYGSRQFTLLLDDNLKPVLKNPDGKVIKSLPQPRQADDPALVKEAKASFSAGKKELKQVVEVTSSRLYEAMCAGRAWPVADWKRYLFQHPIGNRLIQRLIWILQGSETPVPFRPTEDGALIDQQDEEVTLEESGTICLLHRTLLDENEADAWATHLKDYAVKPLFEQIGRPIVSGEKVLKNTSLDRYKGYLSDSFTLRGLFTKLGYQRGEAEDGGFFYYYHKAFNSLGLRAVIQFSGNCLPEENVPAALTTMGFTRLSKSRSWFSESDQLPLKDIPPILLSEVMADYRALADKSGGYDEDWESKIPW
jgi:HEAT repeat protein